MSVARDRLPLEEAHHRFYNALAALRGLLHRQFDTFTDPDVREAARTFDAQIIAFAGLHRTLQVREADRGLDVAAYFGQLCAALAQAQLAPRGLHCDFRADEGLMPCDIGQTLALIVVELVTNAAKHGFIGRSSGRVSVALRRLPAGWLCAVQDNGGGFGGEKTGAGSALVAALAQKIGAEVRTFSDAAGVLVCVSMPDAVEGLA